MISIAIVIRVVMAPGPVFLLFFGRYLAKVAACIPMSFIGPLLVKNYLVIVPDVIVRVVRVVDAVIVMAVGASKACCSHCGSQEKRDDGLKPGTHVFLQTFSCVPPAECCGLMCAARECPF
jgi:hypothetical protein